MAKSLSKTLELKVDATQGIKSITDLQKLLKETEDELGTLQIGSEGFDQAKKDAELLKNGLKNLTKSATESGLQFAEFAKNSAESFVQITGLVGIFTSSVDEASQITAKLANVFALVGTVEKTYQAITQGVIIVQEAQAASALLQASATTATATATTTATVAEQGYVATLYSKAVALAITNPLTAVATALVVASTVAYYALTKSVSDLNDIQDKEIKRLKETTDAIEKQKIAVVELQKEKDVASGFAIVGAEKRAEAELKKIRAQAAADAQRALENDNKKLLELEEAYYNELFSFTDASEKAITEARKRNKELQENATRRQLEVIAKETEAKNKELDQDRNRAKLREQLQLDSLATETSINSKRSASYIGYQMTINDIQTEFDKKEITLYEANKRRQLAQQELQNQSIELLREERNQALEARNITREGIIKDLETKNDIASQFLIIQLEQQQAEDELATAILNKEIPAIQQSVKQQEIKNETLRKNVKLQEQINALLLESERNTAILQLEEITRKLNEATGDFVKDYTNDLKIIEAESIEANEKIRVEFEKRFKEAGDNPELKKALKTELDAALSNAKSIEEAKKKERKKGFVVEIEEENVKNVAIEELQKGSLERQLQNDATTFEERKKLNQALLDLEVKRLRAQEALQIAQAGKNEAEIQRIKETTDVAIKAAEGLTEVANKEIDDNILTKIFGSPEDINDYIRGSENISAAIRSTVEALDKVITGNAGDNFKAINLAIAETQDLTANLVKTIQSFGKNDDTAERVAAIVQVVGTTLLAITNIVNDAIQSVIERSIENVDKEIDAINERKDELDAEIQDSASRLKELEDNLQNAKLADREAIIKAIEQERLKEAQLAAQKKKAFEDELKLEDKKRELQKKAFIAQKAAAIATAVINTAISVTQAFATVPPPANLIVAALYGALGAAQVATITAQPIPQFKDGGFTPKDSDDSTLVGGVHANEYVIPAPIVRSPRFRPMIDEIEKARLSKNGYQSGGIVTSKDDVSSAQVAQAIEAAMALSERKIVASIIDINAANVRQIEIVDQTSLG